jgi:hypothetical protein
MNCADEGGKFHNPNDGFAFPAVRKPGPTQKAQSRTQKAQRFFGFESLPRPARLLSICFVPFVLCFVLFVSLFSSVNCLPKQKASTDFAKALICSVVPVAPLTSRAPLP